MDVTPESDSVCIFRIKDLLKWLLKTSGNSLLVGGMKAFYRLKKIVQIFFEVFPVAKDTSF